MFTQVRHYYEFPPFCLDVVERLLLRDGEIIPLTPKAFDVLLLLVQNSGHVVERSELMNTVWPETFVEEANLTQNIFMLRKALGESSGGNKFILTIAKRGYRFVANVKEASNVGARKITKEQQEARIFEDDEEAAQSNTVASLAVLPFTNLSSDPGTEYLSDGITETIINNLSQLSKLKVCARSSVFRYKGKEVAPQQVRRELAVSVVLMGRVLSVGESLIIRTELIDTVKGWQLWGEQYNRKASDLLEVQEEIAREITEKLQIKLTGAERRLLSKRYTQNNEAYHLYLKGRFFWNKYTREGVERGINYFRQAIELDPNYALAYAGLADAYHRLSNIYLSPREAMPKAKAAALKAVEIDDYLAEAHASLGLLKMYYDHDWDGAEREYRRAIELNPGSSLAHKVYADYLTYIKRFDEALGEYRLALQFDPLSLQANLNLGTTLYLMCQYQLAIAQLQKVMELDENYCPAHLALGCTYLFDGDSATAISEFKRAWQLDKEAYMVLGFLGYAYAVSGNKSDAVKVLKELETASKKKYVSPYGIAITYLGLGDTEGAIKWLRMTYDERNDFLVWLNVAPELDALRSDPRFEDLLRRVGFTSTPRPYHHL